jgi:SagB-type dehydrogenase family enzyme
MDLFSWSHRRRQPDERARDPSPVEIALAYHERSKHAPGRFARGPAGLDWDNQPDPFKRWIGAREIRLQRLPPGAASVADLRYTEVFHPDRRAPAPLDLRSLSQLFFDALAISAWKEYQGARWALRVNPSSGNLHPTEAHLWCGPVDGVTASALVAHYAPREHLLEVRCEPAASLWDELARDLPAGSLLVGLSSIHWREAWKYGERSWRYCQHDAGHAMAALALSAAALGWHTRLVHTWSSADVELLLGLERESGLEREVADLLLVVSPQRVERLPAPPSAEFVTALARETWRGQGSRLSHEHVDWEVIEIVSHATRRTRGEPAMSEPEAASAPTAAESPAGPPWRALAHHRRSAVDMDGVTSMPTEAFFEVLRRVMPAGVPFTALPWRPAVDLVLFVHRVEGLQRGMYALVRDPARLVDLRSAMRAEFQWELVRGPFELPLYLLQAADVRGLAGHASCDQAIASEGCFSLGMLADFSALERFGAHSYTRLFWETGAIGQVFYLEAEAHGLRGTGIGCYYDDVVHAALGLRELKFQSLYHFACGKPVEDRRLTTLAAYSADGLSGAQGTTGE